MCWHKWSKWGKPVINFDGYKVQHRCCEKCGVVVHRKFWDGQAPNPYA